MLYLARPGFTSKGRLRERSGFMSRGIVRALVTFGLCGFAFGNFAATPAEVDTAIKRGVEFLYTKQNDKGNWENAQSAGRDARKEASNVNGGQWGGLSSLA